jgi:hypothetical protein
MALTVYMDDYKNVNTEIHEKLKRSNKFEEITTDR